MNHHRYFSRRHPRRPEQFPVLGDVSRLLLATCFDIQLVKAKLMDTVNDLAGILDAITANLTTAQTTIVAEIAELKSTLTDTDLPQAAEDSIARLQNIASALLNINQGSVPPGSVPPGSVPPGSVPPV